jgi:uncharacterized repeat protein (TIGR03847 family)
MPESNYAFDLDPASFVTVGAQGPPGQRAFFLQGAQGSLVVSILMEKQQAAALASGFSRLLANIEDSHPGVLETLEPVEGNLELLTPIEPSFRAGQIGIGVDDERQRVVVVVHEVSLEDDPDTETESQAARFVLSYEQTLALVERIPLVVEKGRPICPACGEPMEPEGHSCPRRNGHSEVPES